MLDTVGTLPNFFILGAMRAGTGSLAHYLEQHPAIHFIEPRDAAFFQSDELYQRGLDYYIRTFCHNEARAAWLGEASPSYFAVPDIVGARLVAAYGNTPPKFVVLLREPVSRAWSHYLMRVHHGYEKRDFATALAQEEQLKHQAHKSDENTPRYFAEGCYTHLIHQWQTLFPLDSFLFLLSEDLAANPLAQVQHVFKWLGVDTTMPLNISKRLNVARYSRSPRLVDFLNNPPTWASTLGRQIWSESWQRQRIRHKLRERLHATYPSLPPLDPAIATDLRQRYHGEVLALSKLLGRYLSHWLTDEPVGNFVRVLSPMNP